MGSTWGTGLIGRISRALPSIRPLAIIGKFEDHQTRPTRGHGLTEMDNGAHGLCLSPLNQGGRPRSVVGLSQTLPVCLCDAASPRIGNLVSIQLEPFIFLQLGKAARLLLELARVQQAKLSPLVRDCQGTCRRRHHEPELYLSRYSHFAPWFSREDLICQYRFRYSTVYHMAPCLGGLGT